jgi:actin beta/gamma 1
VVIDHGSFNTKVGYSGEEEPSSIFQTCVAAGTENVLVGDQISSDQENVRYPVELGVITDWDNMEHIWKYIFSKDVLDVNSQDHPILLSEAPLTPKLHRERLCQIMFEQYNVPGLYIASSPVLGLYSAGRITGVVLDVGHRTTNVVPLIEGYMVHHAAEKYEFGGVDLENYLQTLLAPKNAVLTSIPARRLQQTIRDIKEQYGHIVADFDQTVAALTKFQSKKKNKNPASMTAQMFTEKTFDLPDGKKIVIGPQDRFQFTEALFRPHERLGLEMNGLHRLLFESIGRCDLDIRKEVQNNIVICGGTTMFPGFVNRLQQQMEMLIPSSQSANVIATKERKNGVWTGGAIISQLSSFSQMWVRKKDYNEYGPQIINRKTY